MTKASFRRPRLAPLLGLAFACAAPLARAQTAAPTPAAPTGGAAPQPAGVVAPPPASSAPPPASPAPAVSADAPAPAPSVAASEPAQAAPAPDAASEAASDAEAAAVEAELKSGGSDSGSEFKLNLYGFADFNYSVPLGDTAFSGKSSFAVGKLNLYTAAELGDDWRSLTEIRFMYLPNGATRPVGTSTDQTRTDTTVGDNTEFQRPVKWGGILIERAWLEHTFHPALTVRAGQWLTPYGIWNVDHGSPVIIGARRPYIVGESLFPERQTGIEAYGTLSFGPSQIGYHLTLSNGRGPIDTYQDLDNNKAIGGRVFFKQDTASSGTITVGVSGYRGKYTNATDAYALDANGNFAIEHTVLERYDELSLAADAKWEWEGLVVQSEVIINDVAYAEGHRPADPAFTGGGPPGFNPDYRKLGAYGIAGYRTSFLGIMPFAGGEYYDPGLRSFVPSSAAFWGGINARPTPRVVLKGQYTHAWFPDTSQFDALNMLDFQAAWSF